MGLGATFQRPSHWAFMASEAPARHHDRGPRGGPRTSAGGRRPGRPRGRWGAGGLVGAQPRLVARAAEGPAEVAAEEAERGRLGLARRASVTTARASASDRTTTPSAGSGPRCVPPCGGHAPPRPPGATPRQPPDRAARAAEGHARRPPPRLDEGLAAWRAVRAGVGLGGDLGELAEEVDELLDVADEVAAGAPRPRAPRRGRPPPPTRGPAATKPGSGGRVTGSPASLLVEPARRPHRPWTRSGAAARPTGTTGAGVLRAPVLVGEAPRPARPAGAARGRRRAPLEASATSRSDSW